MENLNPEEMILGTINKLRDASDDIDEYVSDEAYLPEDKELRQITWSNKDILFKIADVFLYVEFKLLGINFINEESVDDLFSNGVDLDELADVLTFFKDTNTLSDYIKNNIDVLNDITNRIHDLSEDDTDSYSEWVSEFISNNHHISEIFNTHLKGSKDTLLYLLNVSAYLNITNIQTKTINTRKMVRSNSVVTLIYEKITEVVQINNINIGADKFYSLLSVLLTDVYDCMVIDTKELHRIIFSEVKAKQILKNNPMLLHSLVDKNKLKYSKVIDPTAVLVALIATYVMEIENMFTFRIIDDEHLETIDKFIATVKFASNDNNPIYGEIETIVSKLKEHYKTKTY